MTPELRDIMALVESGWRHVAVLVVGDVMLDQYVWGEVERISPEAPVPVLRATLRDQKPGGAANVAMNLAGLGARVTLVGFGGGDREQGALESLLADEGIEPLLTAVPDTPTTTKLRILSGHQQMMRLDSEAGPDFSEDDYRRLLERAFAAMADAAVVVLSDYAKGTLPEAVCQAVIQEARKRDIPVLVDPKSQSLARYRGATAICPNLKELAAATGEAPANLDHLLGGASSGAVTRSRVHHGDAGREGNRRVATEFTISCARHSAPGVRRFRRRRHGDRSPGALRCLRPANRDCG